MSLWRWWRRWRCKHEFRGVDIGKRDESGYVHWPCHKCGYVARVQFGFQVPGKIVGPWGTEDER